MLLWQGRDGFQMISSKSVNDGDERRRKVAMRYFPSFTCDLTRPLAAGWYWKTTQLNIHTTSGLKA